MKLITSFSGAVLMILLLTGIAVGQSSSAEFRRRVRAMRAQHDRRVKEMQTRQRRQAADLKADFEGRTRSNPQTQPKKRAQRSFDPATAPSPADCLKAYIARVATAQSLRDLDKYLPRRVHAGIKDSGNVFPGSRKASDEFARSDLKRRKRIARNILDVQSVRIDGNKAVIMVSTTSGGISNGVEFPYGTARIDMLGEYKYWKIRSYNDTGVHYKHRPQPKR